MLRRLYRCAVRLHPPSFRRRFAAEMLYIFDQHKESVAAIGLLLDCVFSLSTQWRLRIHNGADVSSAPLGTPTSDHIPSFETFDGFQPRMSAIIHGALLTLILFYMTVFGIRYSWIHVLNVHIPEIGANPTQPFMGHSKKSSVHVQVDVIPTEPESTQAKSTASTSLPASGAPARARGVAIWLRLDLYVGKYVSNSPPAKIWIRIEGDHLSLAVAGRPHLALSPVSPTRFVIGGTENNYVEFTPDDQGRISGLSLVEGGNVITARRQ